MQAVVHGFDCELPDGSDYPQIVALFPWFNAPLVELVQQCYRAAGRPICVVDVGAAVGDTVLLLQQRCAEAVAQCICVEGDADFFAMLEANVRQFENVVPVRQLLARERGSMRALVKRRCATAAAVGPAEAEACPLDEVPEIRAATPQLLKVDADGFDGEILAGAVQLLQRCAPAVIFEWHPRLIAETGNNVLTAFETLGSCGYERYLWFNNVGTFSHFAGGYSAAVLEKMAAYLCQVNSRADEHFDVIALHPGHRIDEVSLAAMEFARGASALG